MVMMDRWTVNLLEGSVPWSDAWTPDTRTIEIDAEILSEIIELDAGDPGLFRTLVDMLRHDIDAHLPILRDAATSRNTAGLSRIGHSLAGEAAQIGASSLAVHCRAIESAALRNDFPLAGGLVEALTEHLEQFITVVQHELDEHS